MKQIGLDIALSHYLKFLHSYSKSHNYNGKNYTHSIPSSFVYTLIKDNCIWLLNLIIGIAGYSVYFDDSTESSKVISLDLLNKANVQDPCLKLKSTIIPWTGLLSSGKSPYSPVDKVVTGLGIAHFNKAGLPPFYKGEPITAVMPLVDADHKILRVDGVMQTETCSFTYNNNVLTGWGMEYNGKKLSLDVVTTTPNSVCYSTSEGNVCILKGTPSVWKLIGPEYGKTVSGNTYMSQTEATQFIEWSKYHLNDSIDCLYPPVLWMAKYWSPFLSWHNGTQENSIQAIMMASSILNSGGTSKDKLNGSSLQAMIDTYVNGVSSQSERDHRARRIANTQRAIALLEFIKRV